MATGEEFVTVDGATKMPGWCANNLATKQEWLTRFHTFREVIHQYIWIMLSVLELSQTLLNVHMMAGEDRNV